MISAFGVQHGEVSKAFVKLRPKLGRAFMDDTKAKAHLTMDEKLRRHALEHRMVAGGQGQLAGRRTPAARKKFLAEPWQGKYTTPGSRVEGLRQYKKGAQGIYDVLGRQGRKNKVLP